MEPLSDDVTREDFLNSGWESVLSECERKECIAYQECFATKSRDAEATGNAKAKQIFYLLGALCSLWPKLDSPEEPYDPMASFAGGRTPIVSDFDGSHITFLESILTDISDPELQARVADVLWLRKRNHQYAETAVKGLLASAKSLNSLLSVHSVADRVERSAQIALSIGRNNAPFLSVIAHIEEALNVPNDANIFYEKSRLMEILQDNKVGDPVKYAAMAGDLALIAESAGDSYTANIFWTHQAKWHLLNKDENSAKQSKIKAAETYMQEAERHANSNPSGYLVASHFMQQAFEAMRRAEGMSTRAQELHARLLEYQRKTLLAFKSVSVSVPIDDISHVGIDHVKGKPLHEALLTIVSFCVSHPKNKLREQAIEHRKEFVFHRILPKTLVNGMGRVIARQPENEEDYVP